MTDEDEILTRIAMEAALAKLPAKHRAMMLLIYRVECPEDWTGRWPPRFEDIGYYIGVKFEKGPLSEAAIRYRREAIEAMWRGCRGPLRTNRTLND